MLVRFIKVSSCFIWDFLPLNSQLALSTFNYEIATNIESLRQVRLHKNRAIDDSDLWCWFNWWLLNLEILSSDLLFDNLELA